MMMAFGKRCPVVGIRLCLQVSWLGASREWADACGAAGTCIRCADGHFLAKSVKLCDKWKPSKTRKVHNNGSPSTIRTPVGGSWHDEDRKRSRASRTQNKCRYARPRSPGCVLGYHEHHGTANPISFSPVRASMKTMASNVPLRQAFYWTHDCSGHGSLQRRRHRRFVSCADRQFMSAPYALRGFRAQVAYKRHGSPRYRGQGRFVHAFGGETLGIVGESGSAVHDAPRL